MRGFLTVLGALLALTAPALAATPTHPDRDWKPWRSLPVQDGGRYKPLETLAWETLRLISNQESFTDPVTGEKLDATALYLSMLFDWREDGQAASPHGASKSSPSPGKGPHGAAAAHGSGGTDACPGTAGAGPPDGCPASAGTAGMGSRSAYFSRHQPDKWDRAPLDPRGFVGIAQGAGDGPGPEIHLRVGSQPGGDPGPRREGQAAVRGLRDDAGFTPKRKAHGVRQSGHGAGRTYRGLQGPSHGPETRHRADPGKRGPRLGIRRDADGRGA